MIDTLIRVTLKSDDITKYVLKVHNPNTCIDFEMPGYDTYDLVRAVKIDLINDNYFKNCEYKIIKRTTSVTIIEEEII